MPPNISCHFSEREQNIHYISQNHYNEVILSILMTLLATVKAFITNGSSNTILYKGLVVSIAT